MTLLGAKHGHRRARAIAGTCGLAMLLILCASEPGNGASMRGGGFVELDASARGTSLGGNLAALATGSEAVTWNPAGLLALERREVSFTYADLFGLGLVRHTVAQFGWPRLRREVRWEAGKIQRVTLPPPADRAFGLALTHLGADLEGENYGETQVTLAYAWRLPTSIRAGAALRILWAQSDLPDVGASGQALDLGLQRPWGPFRLGFVARSLVSVTNWDRGPDEPLPQRWRLGLAWSPTRLPLSATLEGAWRGESAQFHQLGLGAEVSPPGPIVLRGAWRRREDALGSRGEWSGGAGFLLRGIRIDYGWQSNARELGETHRWSAALHL